MEPRDLYASTSAAVHARYPFLALSRVHHTNRRAQVMSFKDKPYLIPLYAMMPSLTDATFCKGVQTGLSELLIAYTLHEAGWKDRICAYVLPQYKTSERFVADRIDPVLMRTPAYASRLPGGDFGLETIGSKGNLKRKRFGRRGSLLFLGSNTPSDFIEFSCDVAIVDEWDNCDLSNVANIKDRTRESENPQIIRVSNPRLPGRGVTRLWNQGTQGRWFHQCPRCNERQYLDWFRHFVERDDSGTYWPRDKERASDPSAGDLRPVCQRCARPWERVADGGVWVAAEPRRAEQSFHISRLDVLASRRDPQPMRAAFTEFVKALLDRDAMRTFWAGVLGWAYEPEGTAVTQSVIDRAAKGNPAIDYQGGDTYRDKTVVMGVDVGSVLNVKVSTLSVNEGDERHPYTRNTVWAGAVPEFEDLHDVIGRYHVDVCVIDAMPETRKAKELRDRYAYDGSCQVWLARYHPTPKVGADAFGLRMDYDESTVTVDRTQLLDACLDDLAHGRNLLPRDINTVLHFSSQMRAAKRKIDEKTQRAVWDEGADPDHYRHADAYERVAVEIHDRSGGYYE